MAADAETREDGWLGDRFGRRPQRSGVGDAPVGPRSVVVMFVLAQGVQQMRLVPDQRPVEEFVAAGLDPTFHDRVHAGMRAPLSTTSKLASARIASNLAG